MEKLGVDSSGGKCRRDNGWKAIRKEKKSRAYKIPTTWAIVIITAKTQKPSPSRPTCRPHIKAVFRLGIRLKLSSYNLFTFNQGYYHFNFYGLVKNNNYVLTVLTVSLSSNFHVLVLFHKLCSRQLFVRFVERRLQMRTSIFTYLFHLFGYGSG